MLKKIMIFLITSIVLLLGTIYYRVGHKKTEVVTYKNDIYTLTVFMIGEPEWPFGRTHCCFELKEYTKKITKYKFSVRNDGCFVSENNFDVNWHEEYCLLFVDGQEQAIVEYKISYKGNVLENKEV